MNALNLDNWICDLYSHIDAQRYITGLDQRQYRDHGKARKYAYCFFMCAKPMSCRLTILLQFYNALKL